MQLTDIFAKDITRQIEGVIKADDDSHIGVEVDEYVLTNEASSRVEALLEAYTDPMCAANGTWVSGFFGSGKSHLLKMLAHLLGDVPTSGIERDAVVKAFLTKAGENAMLAASIRKAATIPARSLLFNIDQKAYVVSKDQTDALVRVFVKVFDDACGYYGTMGHIAQFERDLDRQGKLVEFAGIYARVAGIPWSEGRELSILEEANVDAAYAELVGSSGAPQNILAKYRDFYQMSIEDFAAHVKDWLDTQPAGTRLNFYVDEVGQFIGGNTKLMLNLQTVAETLATTCAMRAWVMVTSQEDMDAVIGDRTTAQGNDFSKIQARFANRLKLTSANVEEVIQKRLLTKIPAGVSTLSGIYAEQVNNFPTLFGFADGSRTYRNYTDEDHFVASYPFVTYQFPLFQAAITGISEHNGFEGRHSSVGERSMLGVFQEVGAALRNTQVGQLATFDALFEGIRASLKTAAQNSIIAAENNLTASNPLAVRVLKALFLVKYVPDFKSTARNVTVLLYGQFGQDLPALATSVQEALNLLEQQTYIQCTGNLYEYLTNDEKDIEEEIKAVEVDSSAVTRALADLVRNILKNPKIRYTRNGQDFGYCLKIDDVLSGAAQELSINVITPEYEFATDTSALRAHTIGKDELRVVLPPDQRLYLDLLGYLRTDKYIRRGHTQGMTDSHRRILENKAAANTDRFRDLSTRMRDLIGRSTLMVAGSDLPLSNSDPVARIETGFQDLVTRTYPNLKLLDNKTYSEADIATVLADTGQTTDDDAVTILSVAEQEVLAQIRLKESAGERVTVTSVLRSFTAKPNGWSTPAILAQLAHLANLGRITLTLDSNRLKRTETSALLRNTQRQPQIIVSIQQTYTPAQVRALRDLHRDFFDEGASPRDTAEAAKACADGFTNLAEQLESRVDPGRYPFTAALAPIITTLRDYASKPEKWLVEELPSHTEDLLEAKEASINPILGFFRGPQKDIYDQAASALGTASTSHADLPESVTAKLAELLADPSLLAGGGKIPALKNETEALTTALRQRVTEARRDALADIDARATQLQAMPDWAAATQTARDKAAAEIQATRHTINSQSNIAAIRQDAEDFANLTFPRLLDALARSAQLAGPVDPRDDSKTLPPRATVALAAIPIHYAQPVLATEADVDGYVQAVRTALLAQIRAGKRVTR